jgi:hypothetical protein
MLGMCENVLYSLAWTFSFVMIHRIKASQRLKKEQNCYIPYIHDKNWGLEKLINTPDVIRRSEVWIQTSSSDSKLSICFLVYHTLLKTKCLCKCHSALSGHCFSHIMLLLEIFRKEQTCFAYVCPTQGLMHFRSSNNQTNPNWEVLFNLLLQMMKLRQTGEKCVWGHKELGLEMQVEPH